MAETGLTIEVSGTSYPVFISDINGEFVVTIGGHGTIKADSYAELKAKARKAKTPFELSFSQFDEAAGRVRHGTVTGIHSGNRNLLIRWDDGATEQSSTYRGEYFLRRLDEDETADLNRLSSAYQKAARELFQFREARKFPKGIREAVNDAQRKAAEAS